MPTVGATLNLISIKLTLPYVDMYFLVLNPLISFANKLKLLASRKN